MDKKMEDEMNTGGILGFQELEISDENTGI